MNHYEKFARIKKFTDSIGTIYGTEDFSIYLYSIVKMIKPKTVLELGTGFGTTALWAALGLQENNQGVIHTFDDGSEWHITKKAKDHFQEYYKEDYKEYIMNLFNEFDLHNQISFYNHKISKISYLNNIDIIFCDYSHGPYSVIKLFADYLSRMSETSYIFIDSASTYYSSFHTLESMIGYFNLGKIPKTIYEMIDGPDLQNFHQKVLTSKFELTHIIESKQRNQNSTAQIKIIPIDVMPQPRINVRF
jgi:predicted O-methyltransferase YrrM